MNGPAAPGAPARAGEAVRGAERGGATGARLEPRDLLLCLGVFAVALAIRLVVVSAFGAPPTWDGEFYHRGALSIASGHGYSEAVEGQAARAPWSHYPVGYSAFIGAAYAVFGAAPQVAWAANAVIGALTAALTYLFAFDILGRRRGLVAGVLGVVHPGLVLYCALFMTEPLAGFLALLSGYLARKVGSRRWGWAASGAALAAGAFVRPQSLLALPLSLLLFPGSWRQRLARMAGAGAVCVALIAPWTARNCLVLDGCALISTNGGWNLAISALSPTGRFRPLTPADGCAGVDGPVAQDRCWAERGWAAIREEPWAWAARIPDKLRHTYNHESFAVAYLAEADPGDWDRQHTWHVMNVMTSLHHVLMFAAALATVGRFSRRRWREQWGPIVLLASLVTFAAYALSLPDRPLFWIGVAIPLLGLIRLPGAPPIDDRLRYLFGLLALTSLTHMVFFGDDRYHLAVSPVFCILAAAALRPSLRAARRAPEHLGLERCPAQATAE